MSIVRSVALVNLLLSLLLAPFSATAQEKSHVTSEQVNKAVQELEQLAQKKIQENAVPGLAIAVVFQTRQGEVRERFRHSRCEHKGAG